MFLKNENWRWGKACRRQLDGAFPETAFELEMPYM